MKNKIIIISGATATGKTSRSIEIAKKVNAEIVNFDSLLFYKELNIGTAKPTSTEMQDVKHHLINNHSIANPINASDFMKEAIETIKLIHKQDKIVILAGGSGFYLQTILNGMYDSKTSSPEVITRSNSLYKDQGILPFREFLKTNDIESFNHFHENDHYRNRRAVEHYWMNGTKFSDSKKEMTLRKDQSPRFIYDWDILHCYLDIEKDKHYEIIVERSNDMYKNGLVLEVENLLAQGFTGNEKPLKSIGYKETIDFINGMFKTKEEYLERLSINTRRLAKSQRTWFKKVDKNIYHTLKDFDKLVTDCMNFSLEK